MAEPFDPIEYGFRRARESRRDDVRRALGDLERTAARVRGVLDAGGLPLESDLASLVADAAVVHARGTELRAIVSLEGIVADHRVQGVD